MKQIIYKSLFVFCFLIAGMISINAQGKVPGPDVSSPAYVKTHPEMKGFYPAQMSDNGRYIVANTANMTPGNVAKVWDVWENTVTEIGANCWARDVSNDGVIVGEFIKAGGSKIYGGIYKNNTWTELEPLPDYKTGNNSAWRITPDGKFIGGVAHYSVSGLKPVVWNAEGKFVRSYGVKGKQDYRAGIRSMSDDGMKVGGWSERVGEHYFTGRWIPCFWNKLDEDPIPVIIGSGQIDGINSNGTIAVGTSGPTGVMIEDNGTITNIGKGLLDISENGIFVGDEIYTEELGVRTLTEFFVDLYGLEMNDPFFVQNISDNGEYMAVTTFEGVRFGTAYVRVSGDVKPLAPNYLTVTGGENSSVYVSWEKPRFNGYEPIGYNVYREGTAEKINKELVKELSFQDVNPNMDAKNCYTVTSVYKYREDSEEIESAKTESKCIEVISEGGCYSPKHLSHELIYNRTFNLEWQRPLPNYSSAAPKTEEEITFTKVKPNLLRYLNFGAAIHTASDEKHIYAVTWNGAIQKYKLDGEFIESFQLKARFLAKGLTFDGSSFYTISGPTLYKIKAMENNGGFDNQVNTGIENFTRLNYLPFLDDGNGGFEVGIFNQVSIPGTSNFITREGTKIEGGGIPPYDEKIMGVAYYEGVMYVAKREGNNAMKIYLYNPETITPTGEYIDMKDYPSLQIANGDELWGISIVKSAEGIPCLTVLVGAGTGMGYNKLAFLELAEMEGLKGYNVYRNGTKINEEPIKASSFSEKVFESGEYKYEVTSVFESCESAKSDAVNITVKPIGTVNSPKGVATEIVRNNVIVAWEVPTAAAGVKVVGYNVYRDGVKLNADEKYITDLFYTDKNLALGSYTYAVEAFYNNSGLSSKVETKVTLAGFNPTLPPTEVKLTKEERGNIALTWKTPAVGDYEVKSWNIGAIEDGIGLDEGGVFYVASKWEAEDLGMVFDYTLTDIEFSVRGVDVPHTFYIYVDGEVVSTQEMSSVVPMSYNLLKLDKPVTLQRGKSLMVAYKVNHAKGERPVGADRRNNVVGKGDLMSTDGKTWESCSKHGLKANWAISIRLMPYSVGTPTKIENLEMEANENKNIALVRTEAVRNASESIFRNAEVTGYNVYRNDEKINTTTVNTEEFKDTAADLTKNNCYSVEAIFTGDRKSPKSEATCSFGDCFAPTLSGKLNGGYPELKMSVPTSTVVDESEIRYYKEEAIKPIVMSKDFAFGALLQLKPIDLESWKGYTITHINAYFYSTNCDVALCIMENGVIVLDKPINKKDIKVGMNKFVVDDGFTIDVSKTLWVGLKITAKANVPTIGLDAGPGLAFKGDVISIDGRSITTVKYGTGEALDGNWNLSLSLSKIESLTEGFIGYNIYRDDTKINEAVITDKVYVDKTAEANATYQYHATALWNTGCESEASETVEIKLVGVNDIASANVKIYPNPAKDILTIEGEYETVRLYNSVGQECFMQNAGSGKLLINVSDWAKGIYVVEVTSANGEVNRGKVIIK